MVDSEDNLWVGLDNGIDFSEVSSPVSYLGENLGVDGTGYSSAVYKDKLYLGTNQGLYYSDILKKMGF